MADLSQHANYTGAYSGLLNNLWLTLSIAGACLVGYEIEVRIPRRRGWQGGKKRAVVRIWWATKRSWARLRRGSGTTGSGDQEKGEEKGAVGLGTPIDHKEAERRRVGDRESWEYGYIYQPKTWGLNTSAPVPKWPLAWARDVLRIREADMAPIWGLDITLHIRFLRACLFYTLLQLVIVAPILLPLHILYSPANIEVTSMVRAGISSLVESSGSRWLWVHSVLVWWVTLCWLSTVLWIIWGGVGYRRREVARLRLKVESERSLAAAAAGTADTVGVDHQAGGEIEQMMTGHLPGGSGQGGLTIQTEGLGLGVTESSAAEEPVGVKQYRTLMVLNIPPDMRDEETLEDYFNHYIHHHRRRVLARSRPNQPSNTGPSRATSPGASPITPMGLFKKAPRPVIQVDTAPETLDPIGATPGKERSSSSDESDRDGDGDGDIDFVDMDEMETEVEEVILVRKLGSLISLRDRRLKVLKELELAHVALARRVLNAVSAHKKSQKAAKAKVDHKTKGEGSTPGDIATKSSKLSKMARLDQLTAILGGFVDDEDEQRGEGSVTVWEALHTIPRQLLNPYQALTHLSFTSRFRKTNAPLIDYLTTKLAYLTILLDDARAKSMSSYPASSAAFVTFRDARTARLALKVLENHPKRRLACHTQPAPHWSELLWPRLGLSVYRSEFVRGWVVFVGVWAFTLAWIFPVSLFCALTSLTNIAGFLPQLKSWLDANPETASAITSLAPVILVALLTIAICPILLVIANKAETIVTRLGIHNSVMERFWKFLMVNGVVFFAIGQSAIEAYLTAFQTNDFDPLPIVASAFPTAAPYFASYILLQVAIQPCFEIFRFGLPAIVYWFGTRWSNIPRQRSSRTEYPTFSHFSQLPYQLLAGAIMHLFMLLNPLVIPFTLIYYATCYIVWKRQFTYVYGRLYENNGRRSCIRILRYSLDALALGQFVLFAFFILNKAKGEAISAGILFFVTLIIKLVITRAVKQRFDNLEIEEADILCPPIPREQTQDGSVEGTFDDADDQDGHHHPPTTLRLKSKFEIFRERVHDYVHKYAYDSAILPAGHIKPIPFDWLVFAWLDRYFSYPLDTTPSQVAPNSPTPATYIDDDATPKALVLPHHKLVPWEDIPPYWRARGYDDQPAYTEGYDDFIWLPRDPLSTLDLDDTIEMRASLTTSAGGDGRFSGLEEAEEGEETMHDEIGEGWKEIVAKSSVSGAAASFPVYIDASMSAVHTSELQLPTAAEMPIPPSPESLVGDVDLPENIGSDIETSPLQSVRKGTIKFADGVQSIFRRPRADTAQTSRSEALSMRTVSRISTPSVIIPAPISDSPELILAEGGQQEMNQSFLTPHRSTSRPILTRVPSVPRQESTILPGSPNLFSPPKSAPAFTGSGSAPGSRITFSSQTQAELGRSPSGRRPTVGHRNSQSSSNVASVSPSRLISPVPQSATTPSIRSASAFSHQVRDRSASSLSSAQQALLREVMEEERIASQSAREAERAGLETEREEVRKEKERSGGQPLPPATPTMSSGGGRNPTSVSSPVIAGYRNGVDVRRAASSSRTGGMGGAGMVALAANRFAAGRRRGQTMSGHQTLATSGLGERERSGSGAMSGRAGSDGDRMTPSATTPLSATAPRTVIQAQLNQPRVATGISGDTSGSSRTGPAGGVGGLAGLGT